MKTTGLVNATVRRTLLPVILAGLSTAGLCRAAEGDPGLTDKDTRQQQPSGNADSAPSPMMEQKALDRLKQMCEALAAAKTFTVKSRSTVEVPAKTGQYVTLFGSSEVALKRPNMLRVKVGGETPNFDFYYDGKNIAAFAAQNKVYSIDKAPGTIDEMLNTIEDKSGIHFALADVMFSDPYAVLTKDLTSAFVVGSADLDGSPCDHLAFKSRGVNWEVWVEKGNNPLPRCLTVTYPQAQNLPRFLVEFSNWNLQPKLAAGFAEFKPPPNAQQIDFQPQTPTPTGR